MTDTYARFARPGRGRPLKLIETALGSETYRCTQCGLVKVTSGITTNTTKPYVVRVINALQPTGQIFYVDSVDEFYDLDAECNQMRAILRIEDNPAFVPPAIQFS
jgi:hypothetical protein